LGKPESQNNFINPKRLLLTKRVSIISIALIILIAAYILSTLIISYDNQEENFDNLIDGSSYNISLERAFPNISYERTVFLAQANDGTDRFFLVLQSGKILTFQDTIDVDTAVVFLNIEDQVNDSGNEEGLLGLAFDPNYIDNGYFYVYYSADNPRRSVISRFSINIFDPTIANRSSELIILEVNQPYSNHNGGNIVFGPDGYLYIGLGDGGSGGDPQGHGQNRETLLGSILRIDVQLSSTQKRYKIPQDNPFYQHPIYKEEIWAYGLRNPWRFSFDSLASSLWVGDVGQNDFEEINIIEKGGNYGWNIMEGNSCYPPSKTDCSNSDLISPLYQYTHSQGCSITGGYVYRGSEIKELYGTYLYGDYCSGKIWGVNVINNQVNNTLIMDTELQISSFAEDNIGELYLISLQGQIYKFIK
jgi:hypothetical protein